LGFVNSECPDDLSVSKNLTFIQRFKLFDDLLKLDIFLFKARLQIYKHIFYRDNANNLDYQLFSKNYNLPLK
jgi:hypothetical protein